MPTPADASHMHSYGEELLERSSRFVDAGVDDGPASTNPISGEAAVLAEGIALVTSFSHVLGVATDDGIVVFDTSTAALAPRAMASLRAWSPDPVHTIVFTHGHVDHVGGARLLVDEALSADRPVPRVVAHRAVSDRFHRYDATNGYNALINSRQFGRRGRLGLSRPEWPRDWVWPDTTFSERLRLEIGGVTIELRHARGETDDHAWAWMPDQRAICGGDFLTWVFPNAGNPQKVQRYPAEWAHALREMAALGAELFLPAHGLPIRGEERIARVLGDAAAALEHLVVATLAAMNDGATLDDVIHSVRLPDDVLARPYLKPVYDEPEFVVRNIWRLYGGWWDGDPAQLKPAPRADLAVELASLAGGPARLAERARELVDDGELRLACHLVELAAAAAPGDAEVHAARAAVYRARRDAELSLMARGIFGEAAERSEARTVDIEPEAP